MTGVHRREAHADRPRVRREHGRERGCRRRREAARFRLTCLGRVRGRLLTEGDGRWSTTRTGVWRDAPTAVTVAVTSAADAADARALELSVAIVGVVTYFQNGATTRATFVLAILHECVPARLFVSR